MKKRSPFSRSSLIPIFFLLLSLPSNASQNDGFLEGAEPAVKRANERRSLLKTEFGEISAVDFNDGTRFGPYHLQFITLEPNSLFLPVLLHSDMVFYIHTGSGRLNWLDDEKLRTVDLRRGVVFRLQPGSIFYLQSSLEPEREKLRIYALFSSTDEDRYDPAIGAYSSVTDLVRGFDEKVLQESFKAPEEVIEEIMNKTKPPLIVHAVATQSKKPTSMSWELEARFLKTFMGGAAGAGGMTINKKKKKHVYNIYEHHPDFKNCNGQSLTVTKKECNQLKGSNVGLFFVELLSGSMMGPHWNPNAWELGIGVSDEPGMVRVGCSSISGSSKCKNWRFMVGKGDVFVAPKFHPMVQMSFNNGSFVFIGFSTTNRRNYPQFLAGRSSVLKRLDREVLASSFNVNETSIDQLLAAQVESVILECKSCAEEEKRIMEEATKREREEEEAAARKKREEEEEEARKREEEERKKKEEEEEARKREEEARKKREEEEEARKREEEERKKREEEEAARKREEEARQKEERREEEEAARSREEEERKKEAERKKREEEEAAARKREAEETREGEEEATRKREEEAARKEEEETREGEEEEWKKMEEEAARKREEEERKREEERKKREEETREGEEEGARKREEEERKKMEEEAARKREEEERKKEEERQKREEGERKRPEQEGAGKGEREEEAAARIEEERKEEARKREEEEAMREYERKREEEAAGKKEAAGKREEKEEAGEEVKGIRVEKKAVEDEEEYRGREEMHQRERKRRHKEEKKKKNWEQEEEERIIRILGQWT